MAKSIYSASQEALLKVMGRVKADAGITQEELARLMHLSQSTVSDMLRGQRRLDVIEWISFCNACGITPRQFLDELEFLISKGSS